ncbi:MAG: hypothetical protein PF513_07760 [Tenericutes bacterium]|nr:hypothetical protein [Mycoplasmatota bacterium]
MKNLSKLKKDELIKILKMILKDHPEYNYLVNDVEIIKQDSKKVLKAIEREIANHTGSVLKAYQVYGNYKLNDGESKSLMYIAFEFAGYLFEEIDAYGGEIPDDILDITLEVFEDACRLGLEYNQASSINQLYSSLHSSIYNDDIVQEFHDIMSYCGVYDLQDD